MKISMLIQGDVQTRADERRMFGALGPVLLDDKVHKHLGTPITSRLGDIWLVAGCSSDQGEEIIVGFSLLRRLKQALHIRFIYPLGGGNDEDKVEKSLIAEAVNLARSLGLKTIFSNDRRGRKVWNRAGFSIRENNRRGDFVRWEKEV